MDRYSPQFDEEDALDDSGAAVEFEQFEEFEASDSNPEVEGLIARVHAARLAGV